MWRIRLDLLEGEYWYGFCVADGYRFPLHRGSEYKGDIDPNQTENQAVPLLLSNTGWSIWCESGFQLLVRGGQMVCCSAKAHFQVTDHQGNPYGDVQNQKWDQEDSDRGGESLVRQTGDGCLRHAYLHAAKKYFPPSGVCPPPLFFQVPQYNTWIEFMYRQNQQDILTYAKEIVNHGYPPGLLMIDDNWMEDYGNWEFHPGRFPDPGKMMDTLHEMGFRVMLWTCPFVSPNGSHYLELRDRGLLLRGADGQVAIREWWNGYSAVLDMTNPAAADWYHEQNQNLMKRYGVDGFKMDAGDGLFYRDDDQVHCPADANGQTTQWAALGLGYPYNEYRAGFRLGGQPLVQRLADKHHSWDEKGVASLLPNSLAQGIMGYSFSCPDMIGGGQYACFTGERPLDEELFIRYAQCAALMPMMQFSAAPWRVLSPEGAQMCLETVHLREAFVDEILSLAAHAARTGEPIVRYMEYQFPHQGMGGINDQFMLGERILSAPIWQKGKRIRTVQLPAGQWKYVDGVIYKGGQVIEVKAPLNRLPYFERIEE